MYDHLWMTIPILVSVTVGIITVAGVKALLNTAKIVKDEVI